MATSRRTASYRRRICAERHTETCNEAADWRYVDCEWDWPEDRSLRNSGTTGAPRRDVRTDTNSVAPAGELRVDSSEGDAADD